MLPNLFLIGAMKAGTTSLHRYLGQHPEIYIPKLIKEPAFFAFGEGGESLIAGRPGRPRSMSRARYEALYEPGRVHRYRLDSSTAHLRVERSATRIREAVPEAKLMAVLRNPVERAFSQYQFSHKQAHDVGATFEAELACDAERARKDEQLGYGYLHHGFYHRHLRRYYDLFPPERFHIMLYEDFHADPVATVRGVIEFLGLNAGFTPDVSQRYNVSGIPRNAAIASAFRRFRGAKSFVERRLPPKLVSRLGQPLLRRERLDATLRARLLDVFRDDIERLQGLIGRDLSRWLEQPR